MVHQVVQRAAINVLPMLRRLHLRRLHTPIAFAPHSADGVLRSSIQAESELISPQTQASSPEPGLDSFYDALMMTPPPPRPPPRLTPGETLIAPRRSMKSSERQQNTGTPERLLALAHHFNLPLGSTMGEASKIGGPGPRTSLASSLKELRKGEFGMQRAAGVLDVSQASSSEAFLRGGVLDRLEAALGLAKGEALQASALPTKAIDSLLRPMDWEELALSAARDQSTSDIERVLRLMCAGGLDTASVLEKTTLWLANDAPNSVTLHQTFEETIKVANKLGIANTTETQLAHVHMILYRSPSSSSALQTALSYLTNLERLPVTPSSSIYLQIFNYLAYTGARRHHSIDLFDRMRLKAHPDPPIECWNAVLKACAMGPSTEPERALDLFQEVVDSPKLQPTAETYTHVIRALARARRAGVGTGRKRRSDAEKWWFASLRMLGRMVNEGGVEPQRDTFVALLEGAKRIGDLERAKWIFGLVLKDRAKRGLDEKDGVDVEALASLFQTYASFKLPMPKPLVVKDAEPMPIAGEEVEFARRKLVETTKTRRIDQAAAASTPVPISSSEGESFFASLPKDRNSLLDEINRLFASHVHHIRTDPKAFSSPADQRRLALLHASYLAVYVAHAGLAEVSAAFARTSFSVASGESAEAMAWEGRAPRSTWAYVLMLEACEKSRSPKLAGRVGREIWSEYLEVKDKLAATELLKSTESMLLSHLWATWIRIQAKFGDTEAAMNDLKTFVKTYPPQESTLHSPYLLFRHLDGLRLRFVEDDNQGGMAYITKISKAYEKFRLRANDAAQEARRQAKAAQIKDQLVDVLPVSATSMPSLPSDKCI